MISQRVLEALAFDEDLDSTGGDDESIKYLYEPRIAPIHQALAKVVEAASYAFQTKELGGPIAHADWASFADALTALDMALKEIEDEHQM